MKPFFPWVYFRNPQSKICHLIKDELSQNFKVSDDMKGVTRPMKCWWIITIWDLLVTTLVLVKGWLIRKNKALARGRTLEPLNLLKFLRSFPRGKSAFTCYIGESLHRWNGFSWLQLTMSDSVPEKCHHALDLRDIHHDC